MKTSLRRFSLRLSLVAMILCLYAALPGRGLALEVAGSMDPAVMTPLVSQSQEEENIWFFRKPDSIHYQTMYTSPVAYAYLEYWIEEFKENMCIYVQLEDASNPNEVKFLFEESEPAQELKMVDFGFLKKYLVQQVRM